ncbi:MAG: ECF transporter S component [Lachnospiraceae bacterium]
MKGNKKLIYAALFAALCCVITMYPKFPTLFGYIHAGDALVLLGAYVLGPLWGALAAALGSSLADLMEGYVQYFPGTFVIKAVMSLIAGALLLKFGEKRPVLTTVLAGLAAECVMILGYFAYEGLLLGYGWGAAGSIPTNIVQGIFGAAASSALFAALIKTPYARRELGLSFNRDPDKR